MKSMRAPARQSPDSTSTMAVEKTSQNRERVPAAKPSSSTNGRQYDIVIVGCGPSSIGLLYGILVRTAGDSRPTPSIAVVESGVPGSGQRSERSSGSYVRDWFRAAHWGKRVRRISEKSKGNNLATVHQTVPQRGLNGRIVDVPIGVGVGGGTNLNACLFTPPDFEMDFKSWPGRWKDGRLLKDAVGELSRVIGNNCGHYRWTMCPAYAEVCSGRAEQETATKKEACARQGSGSTEFVTSFLLSCNADLQRMNYYESLIRPLLQSKPYLASRVSFFCGATAQRILFDDSDARRATGVECSLSFRSDVCSDADYSLSRSLFTLHASHEIILCAGAMLTPALLMVSGIGDQTALRRSGVVLAGNRQFVHTPAVGKNLRDHVIVPRAFITPPQWNTIKSANSVQAWYHVTVPECSDRRTARSVGKCEKNYHRFQMTLTDGSISVFAIAHFVASLFRIGLVEESPKVKVHTGIQQVARNMLDLFCCYIFLFVRFILVMLFCTPCGYIATVCTATLNICLLNPKSTGCVSVRASTLPQYAIENDSHGQHTSTKAPVATRLDDVTVNIDPAYLSLDEDAQRKVVAGWEASDAIIGRNFGRCWEVLPGPLYRWLGSAMSFKRNAQDKFDRSVLRRYVTHFAMPYYHWCGTCSMGEEAHVREDSDEKKFVVDDALKVQRIKGLRVCDASVFPSCVSGPTALTCAGIGFVASKILLEDIQLQK